MEECFLETQTFPWFDIINLYGSSKVIAILFLT